MSLLIAKFVKKSHIKARIYFIFLKNVLKETWNSFKMLFGPQRKDGTNSYEVRKLLAIYFNLIALILG